jgi:hypothetical protein
MCTQHRTMRDCAAKHVRHAMLMNIFRLISLSFETHVPRCLSN